MKETMISIEHVNKCYGKKQVLNDVTLPIGQGMFGLLGRNGAGKTTLMKLLAALNKKQDGTITVCGIPIENAKEIRRITGYLPQEFSMYPGMTVKEALDYLGVLSGMDKDYRKKRIGFLLEQVNLKDQAGKKVRALSGGMKRRLGIAQALLHEPRVLIVDEPTAGLDPEERIRFRNLLCDVAMDKIVILSTHIAGDVEAACEQLAVVNEGSVIYHGSVEELIGNARGKVYQAAVRGKELEELRRKYIVTNMNAGGSEIHVRFLSETSADGAKECEPGVEDAYMYCLYQRGAAAPSGSKKADPVDAKKFGGERK